jgi:two-component system KDP operon response regulator KdpE
LTPRSDTRSVTGPDVIVIEDDASTRRALVRDLAAHGYRVEEAADGAEAMRAWERRRPDLVLLDLGLPDVDGTSLVRRLRREATTPILVLSARDREKDKIEALELGADDYVTKPFAMGELHARLRALLRRAAGPAGDESGVVRIGPLTVDAARREVRVADELVSLTPREFEVLKVLVAHAGRVVTRGRLLRAVWGTAYSEEAHYIHVYVSQIRRKLAAADPQGLLDRLIAAEPGVGYRIALLDPLEQTEPAEALTPATNRRASGALPPRAGRGR